MLHWVLLLLHLVGFAAFLGGAFTQQQLVKSSTRPGLSPEARDERERLAAIACTKVEVPASFAQVVTGLAMAFDQPDFWKAHWLHLKLVAVVLLLVFSHLEMFNVRKIVKARAAKADKAADELKARHGAMGVAGTLLVVVIMLCVTVLRPIL